MITANRSAYSLDSQAIIARTAPCAYQQVATTIIRPCVGADDVLDPPLMMVQRVLGSISRLRLMQPIELFARSGRHEVCGRWHVRGCAFPSNVDGHSFSDALTNQKRCNIATGTHNCIIHNMVLCVTAVVCCATYFSSSPRLTYPYASSPWGLLMSLSTRTT